ncbi:MAG: hypothetical protein ACP5VP_05685 [Candidatus Limnocylindrales bacterium]
MADLVRERVSKKRLAPALSDRDAPPEEEAAAVGPARSEGEIDYALARFVAANCAAANLYVESPTPFVLKGGLAVFACFGGPRRSKDADLSPSSLEVEVEGLEPPDLIVAPAGMRLLDPTQETDDGRRQDAGDLRPEQGRPGHPSAASRQATVRLPLHHGARRGLGRPP